MELIRPVAVVLDLDLVLIYETAALWIQVGIVQLLDFFLYNRLLRRR